MSTHTDVFVIGAGPAGLTAAYCLTKEGRDVTVIEKDPVYVGGISRTVEYNGFMFDIGGHRFFSKSKAVVDLWKEILPDDFIERPRLSRIYYGGKYYSYPLSAFEALRNLGIFTSAACMASFAYAKAFPIKDAGNFHEWVRNQFGEKLFSIFFKTYTEKVWGMSCDEISADWAAQRIKGLDLGVAVTEALKKALLPKRATESRRTGGQDADRELPVPAQGAGHDVGSGRAQDPKARRQGAEGARAATALLRSRESALADRGFPRQWRNRNLHGEPRGLVRAGARAGREDRADADLAAACARACAIAISSPSR